MSLHMLLCDGLEEPTCAAAMTWYKSVPGRSQRRFRHMMRVGIELVVTVRPAACDTLRPDDFCSQQPLLSISCTTFPVRAVRDRLFLCGWQRLRHRQDVLLVLTVHHRHGCAVIGGSYVHV